MINILLNIENPFSTNNGFVHLGHFHKNVIRNKFFECELLYCHLQTLLGFRFAAAFRGRDHAGVNIEVTILGLTFSCDFRDIRHWDYDNNCWK